MVTHDPEIGGPRAEEDCAGAWEGFLSPCRWPMVTPAALRLIAHVRLWTTVFYEGAERIYLRGKKTLRYKAAKQAAEKVPSETKRTQGLKPHLQQNIFGTAEAVPLSKTGFSGSL